ncbi:hypothetical protein [Nostoc sp. CMAA1605]|uniref:hypothetical protein n=1 Tax=Nostoc sp. CMAA1605 TaxID=2055159 RepID=UPI001F3664E0|nr:hypothetical protein [Nostoc sp. CMAA1605]MCF4969809.1 hypothetical protein [Nostoc sp. CMAA1605]
MHKKNLIPLLTIGLGLTTISALPSQALEGQVPTLYELQGEGITVTYSTTSFDGRPRLQYQDKQQTLQFTGDQIRTVGLEIGTLVTVSTGKTVEGNPTTFSLLLPAVNLGKSNQARITTNGITTINRFSVTTKFNQGQTQIYKTTSLVGTAQAVQF